MARVAETTQEKKLRRNKTILAHYNELKQTMTCRTAQALLADSYSVSKDTITKILFDPNYSNSPLETIVATTIESAETKSVPV